MKIPDALKWVTYALIGCATPHEPHHVNRPVVQESRSWQDVKLLGLTTEVASLDDAIQRFGTGKIFDNGRDASESRRIVCFRFDMFSTTFVAYFNTSFMAAEPDAITEFGLGPATAYEYTRNCAPISIDARSLGVLAPGTRLDKVIAAFGAPESTSSITLTYGSEIKVNDECQRTHSLEIHLEKGAIAAWDFFNIVSC